MYRNHPITAPLSIQHSGVTKQKQMRAHPQVRLGHQSKDTTHVRMFIHIFIRI